MNRPRDIYGKPIEMGPWYWAKSRTGKIVGTGKFASVIGSGECTWFINGTGYNPENFTFVRVVDDPEQNFNYTQAGPSHVVEYDVTSGRRVTLPDEVAKPIRDEVKRIMHKGKHDWCADQTCEICARRMKAQDQSEADLAASGGIVDAP